MCAAEPQSPLPQSHVDWQSFQQNTFSLTAQAQKAGKGPLIYTEVLLEVAEHVREATEDMTDGRNSLRQFRRKSCRAAPPCTAWHCQLAWSPDPSCAGPARRRGLCAGSLPAQACSGLPPVLPAWSGSWAHMSLSVQSTAAPARIRATSGSLRFTIGLPDELVERPSVSHQFKTLNTTSSKNL